MNFVKKNTDNKTVFLSSFCGPSKNDTLQIKQKRVNYCCKYRLTKAFLCGGLTMAEARCMKCKKQVEVKNAEETVMKNGMKAVKGVCPDCGTKVFKILGKSK